MRKRPLQARGPLATYHSQPLPPSLTGTLSLIGTPYTTEARVPSAPQDPHSQLQGAPKQPQEDAPRPLTMPRSSPIRPSMSLRHHLAPQGPTFPPSQAQAAPVSRFPPLTTSRSYHSQRASHPMTSRNHRAVSGTSEPSTSRRSEHARSWSRATVLPSGV